MTLVQTTRVARSRHEKLSLRRSGSRFTSPLLIAGSLALLFLLAGCGSGGSSSDAHKLSGVASADTALAGTVSLKDSSYPSNELETSVAASGSFAFDVSGLTPPFVLRVQIVDGTTTKALHAVSSGKTTANINPLTEAAVAGAAGTDPALVYSEPDPGKRRETAENLATISDGLALALEPLFSQYGITDPTVDANSTGMHALLQDVRITVVDGIVWVFNRATGGVIYQGPASDPASGTFNADNMPPAPIGLEPVPTSPTSPTTEPTSPTTTSPTTEPTSPTTIAPSACTYTYSAWDACQTNNTQTRTVTSASPTGCVGTPVLTQSCTYVPPPCSYTYTTWSACQSDGAQTRTVASSFPSGCVGTPVLSQACTYTAAPAPEPTTSTSTLAFPPLTTMVKYTMPTVSEPALLGSITNVFGTLGSTFNTTTTRVADTRHHYAKTNPWNVDESLAFTPNGRIYNGTTYAGLRTVTLPNEHKTWSNTDPRYIYGANRDQRQWVRVDATTGTSTILKTYTAADVGLSSLSQTSFGKYEGNIDNGDTGAVLIANSVRPFLIDPKTGAVRCRVTSGGGYGATVSDATMSQDGQFLLVNWVGYGIDAYRASDCGFARKLTARNSHYDACVNSAGAQVVVQPGSGGIVATRISDASTQVVYSDSGLRIHVSCRNTKRPGFTYISHYNDTCDSVTTGTTAFHRIYSVKLDGSRQVENFAWDRQACPSSYDTNPMAVPSRLGNRVWWKANWNGSSTLRSFVAKR